MLKIYKSLLKTTIHVLDDCLYICITYLFSSVLILSGEFGYWSGLIFGAIFLNKANNVTLLFKMINYGVEGMISKRAASSVNIY